MFCTFTNKKNTLRNNCQLTTILPFNKKKLFEGNHEK